MVKLQDITPGVTPSRGQTIYTETKFGNFVLDKNGQLNLNRTMEDAYGFRLKELNHNTDVFNNKDEGGEETATSVSGYSNYKQRIDSMFDDSKSVASERSKAKERERRSSRSKLLDKYEETADRPISNNVQVKIEKMFEEISIHEFDSFRNNKNKTGTANSTNQNTLSHEFHVTYLGCKALQDKSVSLGNLQVPLKELYLEYKRKQVVVNQADVLAISREGLKIKLGQKDHLNPFPTIAVWASVKLTFRSGTTGTEYAFLPLVTDPDSKDKNVLFKELNNDEKSVIVNNSTDTPSEHDQSPIFAVVMKNPTLNKQLECHGFVCSSSEDAIVIAANLYQALMKKMKKKHETKSYENCTPDASSSEEVAEKQKVKDTGPATDTAKVQESPKRPVKKHAPPIPSRPLRASQRPTNEDLIELDEEEQEEMTRRPKVESNFRRRGSVPNTAGHEAVEPVSTLRRSVSERRNTSIPTKGQEDTGDILTKVAIPRSRSFLNANGPLTRYSRRYKSAAQNEAATPLGFNEMFNEFRLNEGLESMDDILNAIIDAEGMSFNDLKPIYKEFLLKLAVTLTKDELYQRSKIIMRRQRKKTHLPTRKAFISTTGLRKVFRRTASKLSKSKSSRPAGLEFTSVVFQSGGKRFDTSTSSTSSGTGKGKPGVKRRQSSRRRITRKPSKKVPSTSEDSDFALRRNTVESGGGPNRSSSGYFSCSECSYDSEHCTCTSADKCYCTLGQASKTPASKPSKAAKNTKSPYTSTFESKFSEKDKSNPSLDVDVAYEKDRGSVTSCGCDTDSCADSEKCYCGQDNTTQEFLHLADVKGICQTPHLHQNERTHNAGCPNYIVPGCKKHGQTILEQLKQQGFVASESSLSRAASPSTAWRNNEEKLRKSKECLKTSRSLEFLHIRRPETRQQKHDCPPPPMPLPAHAHTRYPNFEEVLLKEIQNTTQQHKFVEGTRHFCYHGPSVSMSRRSAEAELFHRRRQYSSMRSRAEYPPGLHQFHSCRNHNKLFSSVRSKPACDNMLNHVLFPSNGTRSSLRFQRRMDVYNSFNRRSLVHSQQGSYIDLLNHLQHQHQNQHLQHQQQKVVCPHETTQIYQSSGGSDNLHKLDYDLFTTSNKSESSETGSTESERKVLVVSARDTKGKVLYMGASTRGEKSGKLARADLTDHHNGNACEALSVKKSAEIAALFADVPKTRSVDKSFRDCHRSNSYRLTNMENTLGYLP